ncbi:EpsG family protein [Sedimentibacter hydroxybenzoicus DSM 7310]|uniref:EpsG family protein n=1 Tax=Sedimentibacter hydroxybenzoicus DSM 7310 TaxID=1123245 RepID=A0A974BKN4_SEDHY|nr:EpsG family protein [Sedimentibacter hydroxybenzoicus]NYB74507.1 EpsG family protein [Sedimentibacter hydroxybenzoicus DSM 7310]
MGASVYYFVFTVYSYLIIFTKKNKWLRILPYVILALFSGFRYGVGTDYFNYASIFNDVASGVYPWKIEKGYEYLILFISKIGGTYQLVFLIMSSLTVFFTYKFIKEESVDYVMSSILYLLIGPFYLSSMNGVRQALAISIVAYSLKFIRKNKYVKVIFWIILAGLFHSSAFIILPIAIAMKRRYELKTLIIAFFSVFIIMRSKIIFWIMDLFSYGKYINYGEYDIDKTLLLFVFIGICVIYIVERYGISKEKEMYYNMSISSLMLILLALFTDNVSNVVFMRFNNYFFYSYLILTPIIANKFREKIFVKSIIYIFSLLYFTLTIFMSNNMLPYQFNFKIF